MYISQKAGYKEPTARMTADGKEVKRTLVVETDDHSNGVENRILEHADTPNYGDAYPHDSTITVSDVSVAQALDGNFLQWEVEVTYKKESSESESGGDSVDGFKEDLQVSGSTQQYEIPLEGGYDAKNEQYDNGELSIPVVSTSNEPLLVSVYRANIIINITMNKSNFDFDWMRQFKNTTNSKRANIVGISVAKDQARILDLSASSQVDARGVNYYAVTMSIEITDRDYLLRPMNKGRYKADSNSASDSAVLPILEGDIATSAGDDTKDLPVAEAVRITEKNEPIPNSDTGAHYVEFKGYPSANWGVVNIPSHAP